MLRLEGNTGNDIPAQYSRIVSETLDLKNDIEFGFSVNRSETTQNLLLGARAYQRALNKVKAEQAERDRQEAALARAKAGQNR